MKTNYIFLIFILISCQNENVIIDITKPELAFNTVFDEEVLFQFNEPVIKLNLDLFKSNVKKKSLKISKEFPCSNYYIEKKFFAKNNYDNLILEAEDTSNNISVLQIKPPLINNNPAILKFREIAIKYTAKRMQKISIICTKEGFTTGFTLVVFIRGTENIIYFNENSIRKSAFIDIYINNKSDIINEKIDFKKKEVILNFKNRLSQSYSLIYILDDKNIIMDYFFYYNSKSNPDIKNDNKNIIKYKKVLSSYDINTEPFDINGSTSIKTIIKKNDKYIIKNR